MDRRFECSLKIGKRGKVRYVSKVEIVGNDIVIRTSEEPHAIDRCLASSMAHVLRSAESAKKGFQVIYQEVADCFPADDEV